MNKFSFCSKVNISCMIYTHCWSNFELWLVWKHWGWKQNIALSSIFYRIHLGLANLNIWYLFLFILCNANILFLNLLFMYSQEFINVNVIKDLNLIFGCRSNELVSQLKSLVLDYNQVNCTRSISAFSKHSSPITSGINRSGLIQRWLGYFFFD